MNSFTIETQSLSRSYRTYRKPEGVLNSVKFFFNRKYEDKHALKPTSLKIERGSVVGLVGANGAGKTTLLKILSGLIAPSNGSARVLGFDPWQRSNEFLKKISILLGQKNQLWWDLSPVDSYDLLSRMYDIDRTICKQRVAQLSELLSCQNQLHIQLRRLSLGERMKMELIGSLLHQPEVLFLDEPTIGLDIVAQTVIRDFITEYVKIRRPTIILTSHYMDDISRLADRLMLITQGEIVYDGTVAGFSNKAERKNKITGKLSAPLKEAISFPWGAELPAGQEIIQIEVPSKKVGEFVSLLARQAQIEDLKIEETDFEDVIREFFKKNDGHRAARHPLTI